MCVRIDSVQRDIEIFKNSLCVCVRVLSQDPEIELIFSDNPSDNPINRALDCEFLPEFSERPSIQEIFIIRGVSDSIALRRNNHDKDLHAQLLPTTTKARAIFDAVEQTRIEAIGSLAMIGMAENLDAMLEDKYLKTDKDRLEDAISLLVREKVTGRTPPQSAKALMTRWRDWIEEIAGDRLDHLVNHLYDQREFSNRICDVITNIEMADQLIEVSQNNEKDKLEDKGQKEERYEDLERNDEKEILSEGVSDNRQKEFEFNQSLQRIDQSSSEESKKPNIRFSDFLDGSNYKIFSNMHDEEVYAKELCDDAELERLRSSLDQQMSPFQGIIARLANRLQRRLMSQKKRVWNFDLEEGYLDTARLNRIVINLTAPLSFKMESKILFSDTIVTLLLDNSGSMRGHPIRVAAICADILARTLERCSVKVEILGFTTKEWKGGKSREDWMKTGKVKNPGRLNDLRHIIYKEADEPWRRARRNLGLMIRDGLLKENIDGEALEWVYNRLLMRSEQRKIIMVISDGAPIDDSTLSVNSVGYLECHLRYLINKIETDPTVELLAIGVGHDVTRYYKRAVTILDTEELAGAMIGQLTALFDEDYQRKYERHLFPC
ncbi:cobaltochelatase CobT-related protein [Candidatus Endowatersipora endosymbiont of Watersipora subatra]|uniref:cobaltochelatase CobT-related protein n=1 Tax=Candidatus Endowatersipora endosymbiont of Watersipora subatra TaxID=3077946 RepID=UPI00312C7B4D